MAELGLEQLDIDRSDLARRLRAGRKLLKHERALLADLVEGKKRANHRPVSLDAAIKRDEIAEFYILLNTAYPDQKSKNKPIVADNFSIEETYVDKVMRGLEPERRKQLESTAHSILKIMQAARLAGLPELETEVLTSVFVSSKKM